MTSPNVGDELTTNAAGSALWWHLADQVQRALGGRDDVPLDVQVDRCAGQRSVAQQHLHGADVGTRLQQVRGVGMPLMPRAA